MTMDELKKLLEEQRKAFDEFKSTNDQRLKAIETKGFAPADLEKETKKAQDEIEKKVNRGALGAPGTPADEKKAEQKAARLAYIRRGDVEAKTLVKSDDTGGGYLVGDEMDTSIIKAAVLISPVRELVTVRPISKQAIKQPKLTTAPAMAAKTGEVQQRTESGNPGYGLVEVPTHEFYAIHKVSHQQLEDSDYDIEAELAEFMGWQFGLREGYDVVKGSGVGEARGFLDPGTGVASTNSGTAATIADAAGVADGIIDLVHAVKSAYAANGRFVLNRKTLGSVRKLKDTQKRYLWQPSMSAGLPPTIFDYPYTEVPDMPDEAAGAFPIAFGDFKRAYRFHPRIQSSILRDPYSLSDSGVVKFTAYRRHGGDVVLAEAIRLLKCAA
jgi:HK97 family phage major capsid protein